MVSAQHRHTTYRLRTGINKPTFLWQVSSCQAPILRPLRRPSPLSMLRLLRPACSPVQCKAVSPSAAVSLWERQSHFALELFLFSASSTRSRPVCLFPLQLFWITRPWWRRAVSGRRRLPTCFWRFQFVREMRTDKLLQSKGLNVHCKIKLQRYYTRRAACVHAYKICDYLLRTQLVDFEVRLPTTGWEEVSSPH